MNHTLPRHRRKRNKNRSEMTPIITSNVPTERIQWTLSPHHLRVRPFSSRFLKQFMDWASTSSCDNLFHLLMMTLWEKKYKRESQRQCFFANFQVCPLVEASSAFLKKCDQGVNDNPFISLNNPIKSALFLLSSRDHSPNWRNLVSYGNGLRWGKIRV